MSAIPPNWLASNIQSQGAASRAAEAKNRQQTSEPTAAAAAAKADLTEAIGNDDRDSSVFSDGEGAGSDGRTFSDEEDVCEQKQDLKKTDEGDTPAHLDIEA